ncbi:uncharacterized protein LOC119094161, partial [Pollicipes pollicipes]|uniref:uncharacterized protein LOC119094161 n=1 Tax=Pollicipes pollicipes TaxID=41117 RepID=UPI0018857DCF
MEKPLMEIEDGASQGSSQNDDIYDDIIDYSHEEVEKLVYTCRRLQEENIELLHTVSQLRGQLLEQQKARQLLRRNFSSLLLTARAEIDRKDVRLAELQRSVDERRLRRSDRAEQGAPPER